MLVIKYFPTFDYNKFTSGTFETKIAVKGWAGKSNIANFTETSDLHLRLATSATKAEF